MPVRATPQRVISAASGALWLNSLIFRGMRLGLLALFVAAPLGLATNSLADGVAEPIYLPCFQLGHQKHPTEVARQHPRNCAFSATFVSRTSDGIVIANYQRISWRGWGSPKAEGTAISVDPETHHRSRVRFAVWGKQTCAETTFYKTFLFKRPRVFNPQRLTGTIHCASEPEDPVQEAP